MNKFFKLLSLWAAACAALVSSATANIWPVADTWEPVGDVTFDKVFTDTGSDDGVGDGGWLVNGQSQVVGQGCKYTFYGTGTTGQPISLVASIDNLNSSFVGLRLELYDLDALSVIASSPSANVNAFSSKTYSLSTTLPSSSSGNRIQMRLIRTDNGHTARDFLVDYVKWDDWYFPGATDFRRKPDLPLAPVDSALQAAIDLVKTRLKESALGTNEPSASAIQSAEATFDSHGISQTTGGVTGPALYYDEVPFLKTFAQYLVFHPTDTNIQNKANLTVELIGRNLLDGHILREFNMYDYRDFVRSAVFLDEHLTPDTRGLLGYVIDAHHDGLVEFWQGSETALGAQEWLNTDWHYNGSDTLIYYGLCHSETVEERQRWAQAATRYLERFFSFGPGTGEGIKIDGSGYHHFSDYVAYMYAQSTTIRLFYTFRGTPLQVSLGAYERVRDHLVMLRMKGIDNCILLSLSGRNPFSRGLPVGASTYRQAAIAGGELMGLSTVDPVLGQIHNTLFGTHPDIDVTGEWDLDGFYSVNYSTAAIAQGDGWLVGARGFDQGLWGAEIYSTSNRYGRYQSYGTLEVLYPGGPLPGNGSSEAGFDWNLMPGATTIVLPWAQLHAETGRIDEFQQKNFVGSLSLGAKDSPILRDYSGRYGCFAMDFQESDSHRSGLINHDTSFTFKKSNFFFGDYVVSLGSGISNTNNTDRTATTLYQRAAAHPSAPAISPSVNADGVTSSSYGDNALSTGQDHWLIDNFSTGYYLPSSNDSVHHERAVQSSPAQSSTDPTNTSTYQTGDFQLAYIDHGTSPSSASYEYAVIPGATPAEMTQFEQKMQSAAPSYQVHQASSSAHIVEEKDQSIWGYALFSGSASLPASGPLMSVSTQCLVMADTFVPGELALSITNPDMGLGPKTFVAVPTRQITYTLEGLWTLPTSHPNVLSITQNAGNTTLTVEIVKAASMEVNLLETTDYLVWQMGYGIGGQASDFDSDGDGLVDLIEYASGGNPTDALDRPIPTIVQDRYSFYQESTLTDVEWIVESSADLIAWTPKVTLRASGVGNEIAPGYSIATDGGDPALLTVLPPAGNDQEFFRFGVNLVP